jgi:AcrR family transcriptional regulator
MDSGASDPRTAPRWRRRKESRPGEILAAALDTFVERGYESARLEDIARRAGCTKGTIFLYYESKAELFKATIRDVMVPLIRESEQAIETHKGEARVLFEKLLRIRWERATASRLSGLAKLLFAETERYPDLARFYYEEIHSQLQGLLKRAFDMGVASGEFRPLDGVTVARVAIAPIVFASIWRHSFGPVVEQAFDSDMYFKTTLDILFRGIEAIQVTEHHRA